MKLLVNRPKTDINFTSTGTIEIGRRVSSLLSLSDGDFVNIAVQDGEYLIFKSTYGIQLHKTNKTRHDTGFMRGCNVSLCRQILQGEFKAKYRIGDIITINNRKMLYIITHKNYAAEKY